MANEFKIKNGLIVSGSAEITNNLTVNGTLTAEEYHISLVSSSVLYESGSTKFGDSSDDTHEFTGSLNISGSIFLNGTTVGTGKLDETTFESFTSSYIEVSSSLNERVGDLETESGSIRGDFNSFTSSYTNVSTSVDSRLDTLETLSGSFTGSFSGDGTNLYNIPASGVTGLNLMQIADGSVTASVSNTNGLRVNSKTEITGSLIVTEGITGSIDYSNITNKPTLVSGSVQVNLPDVTGFSEFSSSISASVTTIFVDNFGQDNRLDAIETSTGSLNSFTSSINTTIKNKLNTDEVISGSVQVNLPDVTGYSTFSSSISSSIGTLSSSVATTDNTQNDRLSSLETESGSLRGNFNTYTGSNDTTNTTQDGRLNSLEGITGSYATTGSNSFVGDQIVTGSLTITNNLTVLGSSSIVYSTASQLIVEDNVIVVNASFPAERFSGLEVHDSGSNGSVTASLLWDGLYNRWIYQNSSDSHYGGAMFIAGPRNTGSLGDETTLTNGRIPKSIGGDHIGDSIINEINDSIGISGSLSITGSIVSTGTPIVSGSSQISFIGITDKPTLVSGSSQIIYSGLTGIPSGIVSGSSQVLNGSGVWSGSAQLPAGVVSGSSQITFGSITGVPSGLVSGSSQVLAGTTIHSGSFFNNISVVSGSAQISFGGITGVPSGLVSGSSQIDLTAVTNYSSGIKTRLNTEVVHSGSFLGTATTANLTENTNLYYTDTRSRAALSFTAGSGAYNSTTGVITIPTNTNQLANGAGFLTSVTNISGNAGTVTNGVYTTGDQTIGGTKTFNGTHLAIENSVNVWKYIRYRSGSTILWDVGTNEADDSTSYQIRPNGGSTNRLTLSLSGVMSTNFTGVDQGLTLNKVSGGSGQWNYIGFSYQGTRKAYFGTDSSGYAVIGSDVGLISLQTATQISGHLTPTSNNSYNLGSASLGWANVYTNDLHLSNMNKPEGNDIDGTSGTWTIQEGAENLYIINNRNNKKFKISLEEIL